MRRPSPSAPCSRGLRYFLLFFAVLGLFVLERWAERPQLRPLRAASPRPLFAPPPLPRLLVCIASHYTPGKGTTVHLSRVLGELRERYARHFSVSVSVDTNSAELAARLPALWGGAPGALTVRVWSLAELGDPLHLPYVHRHHVQQVLDAHDYFMFTEDDVLVPLESFQLYARRQRELWALGWMFGWVRAEVWGGDNATAISIDNVDPVADPPVYRAPSGALYAEPWSPYTAFYVLDAEQARAMVGDPSGVWSNGFPPFLPREKMSVGYYYAHTGRSGDQPWGAKGWRARALVPLDAAGRVDKDAIAWHLPRKYAQGTQLWFHDLGSVPVHALFNFSGPLAPVGLPAFPPP